MISFYYIDITQSCMRLLLRDDSCTFLRSYFAVMQYASEIWIPTGFLTVNQ